MTGTAEEEPHMGARQTRRLYWLVLLVIVASTSWLPLTVLAEQAPTNRVVALLKQGIQSELDACYRAAQKTDELFPGATAAVALPDGRILGFATGLADLEKKIAMTKDVRMPAGSIGKTFVAAVALDLVADGKLKLDDRVARWLGNEPWFKRLPNGDTMTVRHLLNHSSGLIDHVFDEDSGFANYLKEKLDPTHVAPATVTFDPEAFVRFALDRKPLFRPGEGFHYSDTGYILLGMIIEKAGGLGYYKEVSRRFLKPLKLTLTSPMNRRKLMGLVAGYAPKGRSLFNTPYKVADAGVFAFDPSLEWTGGGLVTNSQDLVRWAKALFEGKAIGHRYLEEMLNSIAKPGPERDASGRAFGYGLGVSIARTKYGTVYRHGGFFPGYNSVLAYYPDSGIAVAMQINADDTKLEAHFEALVRVAMEALSKKPKN
jgi:D-alanyl-D-alanine carboxypeptidase